MTGVNAPKGLGANGRRAWRTACAGLEPVGLDPVLHVGTLERYAHSVDRLATVQAAWEQLGSPATTTGSVGQITGHPLLRELRDETRAVEQLADSLRLTPAAGAMAGWRRGHARSPDRQARGPAKVVRLSERVREAIGDADAG
jgi:phage terminase small subunit